MADLIAAPFVLFLCLVCRTALAESNTIYAGATIGFVQEAVRGGPFDTTTRSLYGDGPILGADFRYRHHFELAWLGGGVSVGCSSIFEPTIQWGVGEGVRRVSCSNLQASIGGGLSFTLYDVVVVDLGLSAGLNRMHWITTPGMAVYVSLNYAPVEPMFEPDFMVSVPIQRKARHAGTASAVIPVEIALRSAWSQGLVPFDFGSSRSSGAESARLQVASLSLLVGLNLRVRP